MTEGKMQRVNTTMTEEIVKLVDEYAKAHHEDRSTAIRQLVMKGLTAENYERAIDAYKRGRITLREMSELLHLDYWEVQDILLREGIPISSLTDKELEHRLNKRKESTF